MIEIKNLQLEFVSDEGAVRALDGIDLTIGDGETVCLVGESGSGKSVTGLSLARLVPVPPARYSAGEIVIDGRDVLKMSAGELRRMRGRTVSYVFQEPGASLNPVMRIGDQILESLKLHRPEAATAAEVLRLLELVGIPAPESRARNYPHQMSGGMQQRVMIAMAIAPQPKLLVADEPTTALDVTIQAQILDLLAALKERLGMGILLITHNLGIVSAIGDRVAVMYAGQIVEVSSADELLKDPRHPYTRALIDSVPRTGTNNRRMQVIPGSVPRPGSAITGCRFFSRCGIRRPECERAVPELKSFDAGRSVRCPHTWPPPSRAD